MLAIEEVHELLLKTGLEDVEADLLIARLLFEESFDFVKTMCELNETRQGGLRSLFQNDDHLIH